MSATYRSMARLPLKIFEQLSFQSNDDEYEESTAMSIRASVCHKLKQPYKKADPITTVGGFLKQSCMTLVRILDPILTYGKHSVHDSPSVLSSSIHTFLLQRSVFC